MKHSLIISAALALVVPALLSCEKENSTLPRPVIETPADETGFSPIILGAAGEGISASVETKATAVTSLSSFYASATTGSAGSESSVWNSVTFTKDGATTDYKGDKWWPNSNPNYHFFASNASITFAAAGSTVAATNDTDVICAYMASPSYKTKNTLTFEHIFARLGDVEVSAASGYTISGVSISITPKTGGTYNIRTGAGQTDGTGWSGLTTGSATGIANATPGTKSNDIYLVPGTYTLTASWTATRGLYTETISNKTVDVALTGGKVNKITTTLGGNAEEVVFGVSINPWGAATSAVEFPTTGPFGGLEIAPSNLMWNGTSFTFAGQHYDPSTDSYSIDWSDNSYGSVYGKNAGSTYFNFLELGQYFDSHGSSYSLSSGDIDNNGVTVSYNGQDGWRLPTKAEWLTLTTGASPGTSRPGSTVNGATGAKYAIIRVSDFSVGGQNAVCLLLFPDNKTITGAALSSINTATLAGTFTTPQINAYLGQGCAVLFNGYYSGSSWAYSFGAYWYSTRAEAQRFSNGNLSTYNYVGSASSVYFPVRLVR